MAVEIVRLVMEMGWNAWEAYRSGDLTKTVRDILPQRLRDRERLEDLKEQAREDYGDGDLET